jgi:uncharacterized membrane protein required for colicin V production
MWYDVFVIAILIVGMVRGAVRGVVWQLAGIAGIVLCLVFAETISAVGSPYVALEPPLNQWVVMFVAYLFFSFLSFGFARLIDGALEKAELKEYNKHLGAIFGMVKGAALCLVITFFLVTLSESTRGFLRDSTSARYAAILMDRLHPVMPAKLRGALDTFIHELDDAADLDIQYTHQHDHDHGSHGDSEPHWDPLHPNTPAPAADSQWPGAGSSSGDASTAQETLDGLMRRLPGLAQDPWTQQSVRRIYESVPQPSREQFLKDVEAAGPGLLFAVLQRWQSSRSQSGSESGAGNSSPLEGATQKVGYSEPSSPSADTLRIGIAQRLARTPSDQTAYEQYITAGMKGLPEQIVLGALQDWHADLGGGTDPDPETTSAATLEQRIIRQLTLQRVSVFQLSQEVQDRLMKARVQ